jgi:thymidylate synthase (FAD)
MEESYSASYAAYEAMLADGVAREVARSVLPVGIMTEFFWTLNARSLMNFLSLRNQEHAQREIRRYAEAVEALFETRMPITHRHFVEHGRKAP